MKIEVIMVLVCSVIVLAIALEKQEIFKRAVSRARRAVINTTLYYNGEPFPAETIAEKHGNVELKCSVGSAPPARIHWLKNGVQIMQSSSESDNTNYENNGNMAIIGVSKTNSILQLFCVSPDSAGEYSCVAENEHRTITRTTNLVVRNTQNLPSGCSAVNTPGRIAMWTENRMELEGKNVQLFCRGAGNPTPETKWFRDDSVINTGNGYQILSNGDLLITDISYNNHVGEYKCKVSNSFGSQEKLVFVYPTTME